MRGSPLREFAMVLLTSAVVSLGSWNMATAQAVPEPGGTRNIEAIRRVTPDEFQETFKDRFSGGLEQQLPFRMATDSQGRILVTEPFLSLVQVFDTEERRRWQIHGDREQEMEFPTYIAIDAKDNIYLSDPLRAEVMVFRPDGHFLRNIGAGILDSPTGLAIDRANGALYVADSWRDEIQVYSLEGKLIRTIGKSGTEAGALRAPWELILRHGRLFVLESGNARFQTFDLEGNSKGIWPFGNDRWPVAFAFDRAGNLYWVDMESKGLLVTDPGGKQLASLDVQIQYGQPGGGSVYPSFMSVIEDEDGSMLVLRPTLAIDEVKLKGNGAGKRQKGFAETGLWEQDAGKPQ